MHTNNNKYMALAAVLLTAPWGAAQAVSSSNCPTLTLKDLPTAACSSESKPYETAALAGVKFYATTPCPSKIGISKTLQSIFKGDKEYLPTEKAAIPGTAVCSYKIGNTEWQKALNTKSDTLTLTASLPTREHTNYWGAPLVGMKCPAIESTDVNSLKSGTLVVGSSKLDYTFKVGPLVSAGTASGIFNSVSTAISGKTPLPKLTGTQASFKGIELTCHYTHHTGGKESLLELKSVMKK